MHGIVYKEFRQNKALLLALLLTPAFGILFLIPFTWNYLVNALGGPHKEGIGFADVFGALLPGKEMFMLRGILIGILYFVLAIATTSVFIGDQRKHWGYYIASTPRGVIRQVYGKYVILFMSYALFMVSMIFCDSFLNWLIYCVTGETGLSLTSIYILLFFIQLIQIGFELPFEFRFGSKIGSYVRLAFLLLLFLIGAIWILFGPTEVLNHLPETIFGFLENLQNGKVSENVTLGITAIPLFALAEYIISYFISCKGFLKGVANYEK